MTQELISHPYIVGTVGEHYTAALKELIRLHNRGESSEDVIKTISETDILIENGEIILEAIEEREGRVFAAMRAGIRRGLRRLEKLENDKTYADTPNYGRFA